MALLKEEERQKTEEKSDLERDRTNILKTTLPHCSQPTVTSSQKKNIFSRNNQTAEPPITERSQLNPNTRTTTENVTSPYTVDIEPYMSD